MQKNIILTQQGISDTIDRIAEEISGKGRPIESLVLIGIRTGGAYLAARLQHALSNLSGETPGLGILDITLYRDDWTRIGPMPVVKKTEIPFSVNDKTVILVDDVLFTGRTVRAAIDALIDYGRPKKIELAVLVDRGVSFRELPIMADYVGGHWDTSPKETINVYLNEEGFKDHAAIEGKKAA